MGEGRVQQKRPDETSWVPLSACREVFKAKHRKTGKKVALKKVLMENEKEGVSKGGAGLRASPGRRVGFPPYFC